MEVASVIEDMSQALLHMTNKIKSMEETINNTVKRESFIINETEKAMVFKWLENCVKPQSMKLLYRGTTNGFSAQSFHLRCDGKSNLVCFIKSNCGKRFGGYIHPRFQKNLNNYVAANPNYSFIFSIDQKQKYLTNEVNCPQAYYSHQSYGFTLGNHDLYIADNCHTNLTSQTSIPTTYGKHTGTTSINLAATKNFLVDEIEVFEVIIQKSL